MGRRADAMESILERDRQSPEKDVGVKRGAASVMDHVRRLLRRSKSPLDRAISLLKRYRLMPMWGMPKGYEERLAPDMLAVAYNSGTARGRSNSWMKEHGAEKCRAAQVHGGLSDIMDAAVLDDDIPDLVNHEWFERLCRWKYGLEAVFLEVKSESDWKGAKPKTRWQLLEEFHPSVKEISDVRADAAEEEVRASLQRRALFEKYLKKAEEKRD